MRTRDSIVSMNPSRRVHLSADLLYQEEPADCLLQLNRSQFFTLRDFLLSSKWYLLSCLCPKDTVSVSWSLGLSRSQGGSSKNPPIVDWNRVQRVNKESKHIAQRRGLAENRAKEYNRPMGKTRTQRKRQTGERAPGWRDCFSRVASACPLWCLSDNRTLSGSEPW